MRVSINKIKVEYKNNRGLKIIDLISIIFQQKVKLEHFTLSFTDYFAVSSPSISIRSPLIRELSPPLFLTRIRISRQSIRTSSPPNSLFYV